MKLTGLKPFAFVALLLLAAGMVFIRHGRAQEPQAAIAMFRHPAMGHNGDSLFSTASARLDLLAPRHLAPQPQQTDKTVDQTRKNIQVLKGLPDSQLFTVMNFIRSSLGVSALTVT